MVHTLRIDDIPVVWVGLYRHEAEIRRRALFEPTNGTGEYCIRVNLPESALGDWNSLRCEISNDVILQQLRKGESPVDVGTCIENNPKAKKIYDELVTVLRERAICEATVESCEHEMHLAQEHISAMLRPKRFPLETELAEDKLMDYLQDVNEAQIKKTEAIKSESFDWRIKLADINQRAQILLNRLIEVTPHSFNRDLNRSPATILAEITDVMHRSSSDKTQPWVDLHVEITKEGPTELLLSYICLDCSWTPDYDLRLDSRDLSRVDVTYFGSIRQNSGEDWTDVRLTLHSGDPHNPARPPIFPPLKASEQPPQDKQGVKVAYPLFGRRGHTASSSAAGPRSESLQSSFEHPERLSIKSGKESRLEIFKGVLAVRTCLYATPEVSKNVFRGGVLTNTTDYTLLEADGVAVFWDGSFTSRTRVPEVVPGETFEIFFGVDQRVRIDMQPVKKVKKQLGTVITGQSERESTRYNMLASNMRNEEVLIVMPIRLPISTDQRFKVALDGIKPREVALERDIHAGTELGDGLKEGLTWVKNTTTHNCIAVLKLGAAEKLPVTFGFSIDRPLAVEYQIG